MLAFPRLSRIDGSDKVGFEYIDGIPLPNLKIIVSSHRIDKPPILERSNWNV
jgi:hypothetical protein